MDPSTTIVVNPGGAGHRLLRLHEALVAVTVQRSGLMGMRDYAVLKPAKHRLTAAAPYPACQCRPLVERRWQRGHTRGLKRPTVRRSPASCARRGPRDQ